MNSKLSVILLVAGLVLAGCSSPAPERGANTAEVKDLGQKSKSEVSTSKGSSQPSAESKAPASDDHIKATAKGEPDKGPAGAVSDLNLTGKWTGRAELKKTLTAEEKKQLASMNDKAYWLDLKDDQSFACSVMGFKLEGKFEVRQMELRLKPTSFNGNPVPQDSQPLVFKISPDGSQIISDEPNAVVTFTRQ